MKIICLAALKGGVSKTLTTFSIAGELARTGNKVLCIDVDPQANLTTSLGINIADPNLKGTKDIFNKNKSTFEEIVYKAPIVELPSLDVIPGNMLLHRTEFELPFNSGREMILMNYIEDNMEYFKEYDYILIDSNPSFGYLNQNAFVVADSILLLLTPDMSSINGAYLFQAIWDDIRANLRVPNNINGMIISMYDNRTKISKSFMEYIENDESMAGIKELSLNTIIPMNVKLKESTVNHLPICLYDKTSSGNEAYAKLTNELIERGIL